VSFRFSLLATLIGTLAVACGGQGLALEGATDGELSLPRDVSISESREGLEYDDAGALGTDSVSATGDLKKDYLAGGEQLLRGDWLTSGDGRFTFILQDDGNLVLYGPYGAKWASGTAGRAVARCVMQGDGNLVLYDYASRPVWASNTPWQPNSRLVVQSDGNVVIYRSGSVWATNTVVYPGAPGWSDPSVRDRLHAGQELLRGQSLNSTNGHFSLVMQDDGNLVLYGPGRALWASNTAGRAVRAAIMQSDSNLVLYGYDNRSVWASNTAGRFAPTLVLQNDGNLVIYATWAIWATGTRG
jgi:hypothetical protein